jgi:dTMP kinase
VILTARPYGKFIVFDGIDGTGKTTQLKRLARRLERQGRPVVTVRDPGGTQIGQRLRSILLDRPTGPDAPDMDPRCELFLLLASRAQTVSEIVRPALAEGKIVLSDRYVSATLAYQGFGGGLDLDTLRRMLDFAVDGLRPDVTLLFDMDLPKARARLAGSGRPADRIESRGEAYFERVAEGFRALAKADPRAFHLIDADGDRDEVADDVWSAVEPLL